MRLMVCKRCGEECERTGTRQLYCPDCRRALGLARRRAWLRAFRASNPEKVRAKERAFRARNPEKVLAWRRAFRARNPEKARAWSRASGRKMRRLARLARELLRQSNEPSTQEN